MNLNRKILNMKNITTITHITGSHFNIKNKVGNNDDYKYNNTDNNNDDNYHNNQNSKNLCKKRLI